MCAFPAFPSTFQNLRLLEEVLYDLPPLEGVFLHWHTHGVTATTAGMNSLLARRKQLLGPTTLSGASIQLLYACATDSLRRLSLPWQDLHCTWESRPLHARLLRHGSTLSAAETQALLPPGMLVHKTVSMTLADTLLLCTGVGMQRVTRQHLRALSAALELPRRAVKQCTVNPVICNLVETFAMQPGMVSPFLHPSHHTGLGALVLLPWPEKWEAHEREVAISLSLWESLVLPLRCLRSLIRRYARRAYPGVQIIELESEDTHYAHTEQSIAHLAERSTKQMQHVTRFSAGSIALRRGMHKMYAWYEYIRPRWSGSERLLLIASVPREGTTDISDLVILMSATLTRIRCLVRGSLQGEIQLCQK